MATISKDLVISPLTVKVAELTEKITKKPMKIEEMFGVPKVIHAYSVTLGDTEIAQGAVQYQSRDNVGGWVPVLRVDTFEGDFEEALTKVRVQDPERWYREPLAAVEDLDCMLSRHLADKYH